MNHYQLSLESIKKQSTEFYDALTDCVKKLRNGKGYSKDDIKKSFITQVIKQYTGLNIVLHIEEGWNAWMRPPQLTADHILFGYSGTQSAGTSIIDIQKKPMKGWVDPENGKVGGIFSELKCDMMVSTDFLDPGYITDREVAAIILHELGHAFTYFQFMTTIAYGALVIKQSINNIFATDSYDKKTMILKEADQALNIEDTMESIELSVETTEDNLETLLVARFMRELLTRSSTSHYDMRNCEQLADAFAVKFGAGTDLARVNHKFHKEFKEYGNENFFVHVLSQAGLLAGFILLGSCSLKQVLLSMAQPKNYDDPKDRVAFIKFQLIDDLKRLPQGAKSARQELVESISEVDKVLKTIVVHRNVFTFIHETFTVAGKSAKKQQDQMKQLESLLYNDLFYQSAKMKTMYQE